MAATIVGGVGAALTVDEVRRVALGGAVQLDASLIESLDRDASSAKGGAEASSLAALSLQPPDVAERLSDEQSRAVLFVKLAELCGAKPPPPPGLLRALAAALAGPPLPLPAAACDAAVLSALAAALPGCSEAAHAALRTGCAPSLALAALAAAAARAQLLPLFDSVAAFSIDALGSSTAGLEAEAAAEGSKFESNAAADLLALLEGSRRCNARKGGLTPPAVISLPALHGRAREAVAALASACRAALAAPRPSAAQAVLLSAAAAHGALSAAAHAAGARARAAGGAAAPEAAAALRAQAATVAAAVAALTELHARDVVGPEGDQEEPAGVAVAAALCAAVEICARAAAAEAAAAAARLEAADAAASAARAPPAAAADGKPGRPAAAAAPPLGKGSQLVRLFLAGGGVLSISSAAAAALLADIRGVVESSAARRKPKLAKGTRDFLPEQMAIREAAFSAIVAVFKRHGAVALDTPVFELRATLTGKYGEDSKLIYDLADQGGEALSLRYDLTVPFARYLAMHSVGNIKRYHIARVYRRDQPAMARGRFREFYQCDFDIAGTYPAMMADSEVLCALTEVLRALDVGSFCVKLNHRKVLDACLEVSGVPPSKFRAICSAIDKLDKEPWEAVRSEMICEKGLDAAAADAVGALVQLRSPAGDPRALLRGWQEAGSPFGAHAGARAAVEEMALLFDYLDSLDCLSHFSFDLSLARGLDYYTGCIFEAVLTGGGSNVGSVGGGGRYDGLVGMFSGKAVPCVGVSVGIERLFALLEERARARAAAPGGPPIRATQTQVLVCSIGAGLARQRMRIAASLWQAGVKAEYLLAAAPNMPKQLAAALEAGVPLLVIFGEDELQAGTLKVKRLADKEEVSVPESRLLETVREMLGASGGAEAAAPPVVVS